MEPHAPAALNEYAILLMSLLSTSMASPAKMKEERRRLALIGAKRIADTDIAKFRFGPVVLRQPGERLQVQSHVHLLVAGTSGHGSRHCCSVYLSDRSLRSAATSPLARRSSPPLACVWPLRMLNQGTRRESALTRQAVLIYRG